MEKLIPKPIEEPKSEFDLIDTKEEARKTYIREHRPKTLAKYYLRRWYTFQHQINELGGIYFDTAKMLFLALKNVSEENRSILHDKYYNPTELKTNGIYALPSDNEKAKEHGLSKYRYVTLRQEAEKEFFVCLWEAYHTLKLDD